MSTSISTSVRSPRTDAAASRRAWIAPAIADLPPLRELTLQTGSIIGICTPGGGCGFSVAPPTGEPPLPLG